MCVDYELNSLNSISMCVDNLLEFLGWLLCKERKVAMSLVPVIQFFWNGNKFHNENKLEETF